MATPKTITKSTLRIYWQAALRYPKLCAGSLLFTFGSLLAAVAVPYFASRSLAAALNDGMNFQRELMLLTIVIVLTIVTNRIGFNSAMSIIASVQHDLQNKVISTLMQRGISFHTNVVGGKLVSDALDFVNGFNMLFNTIFMSSLSLFTSIILGLLVISFESWQLGLYVLVIVAITLGWAYKESLHRSSLRTRRLRASKDLTAHISDTIVNAQTVKTFAAEKREIARDRLLSEKLRDMRITDWQRAGRSGNNRVAFLFVSLLGLLIVFNMLDAKDPALLATGIFAFTYVLSLLMRLFDINAITRQTEEAFLQAAPMTQIFHEQVEVIDVPDAPDLKVTSGAIDFQDITFSYQDNDNNEEIFSGLSLHIKPGEHVGLVGPSGGGKTTLTRLLLRFEDIQDGTIQVDGQNIRTVTQASLRDAIGYVPQEPLLFHRSVKENISYGRPEANNDEVEHAAKLAHAHEFITKLPNSYDTVVGERGVKLSGGQRQRVAIARAILKNAPVLVLDEATSALDSASEKLIQAAFWELLKGRTALIIAHRLSTIQKMDRIIVLEGGKIVEDGSHQELLAKNGTYAKLWGHQSGGFIEE
jgi:ATP-binding cassette, subfamily B, bacterial